MYYQNILKKQPSELVRRVFNAQKMNSVKGDWTKLVERYLQEYDIQINEKCVENMSKMEFKTIVKNKIRDKVFSKLKQQQEDHTKINNICYSEFKTQGYLKNHMFNNHKAALLFSLRSRTTKDFKANFPYNAGQMCPAGCIELDTPEHCIICKNIVNEETNVENIIYEDIFSDSVYKQAAVVKLISSLLERREDASSSTTGPGCSPPEDSKNSHS